MLVLFKVKLKHFQKSNKKNIACPAGGWKKIACSYCLRGNSDSSKSK